MADERDTRISGIRGLPSKTTHTLSALSGGAFVILFVVSFLIDRGHPTFDDDPAKFVSFYQDHHSKLQIAMLLSIFASFWLAWFFGVLRWLYDGAERAARGFMRASPIAFGGGIAGIAVASMAGIAELTAVEVNGSVPPGVTRMLDLMHTYGIAWAIVLLSVHLLSVFYIVVITDVFPQWFALLAAVGAVIGFFQAVLVLSPAQDNGVFGIAQIVWLALFLIYVFFASVSLARRVDTIPLAA